MRSGRPRGAIGSRSRAVSPCPCGNAWTPGPSLIAPSFSRAISPLNRVLVGYRRTYHEASMRRFSALAPIALASSVIACGGDPSRVLVSRWKHDGASEIAPAGIGPEGRVIVALRTGTGDLRTLEPTDGRRREGPFPAAITEHAPVAGGDLIHLISVAGRIFTFDYAGAERATSARVLARTTPLARAPDGGLR